jgi:hypothetical protein
VATIISNRRGPDSNSLLGEYRITTSGNELLNLFVRKFSLYELGKGKAIPLHAMEALGGGGEEV